MPAYLVIFALLEGIRERRRVVQGMDIPQKSIAQDIILQDKWAGAKPSVAPTCLEMR